MECYQWGGGKGTGNKKHKYQVHNTQGEVKNSMRNGEAKELICGGRGCAGRRGIKGENGTTVTHNQ